ncbi:hypothetical protein [Streptomyces sp. MCL20-2]|uniref:hypothetical protein n=1 Tax=Streptomyces sp. MCL20-2 TaxID=2967219 RepID=UPI0029674645|nr:hypothetical protein [Streptomyces sp. MCL20-2]
MGFAGAVGVAAEGLSGFCGVGGSDVRRWSTGMAAAAGGTAPGADGTTPVGISRSGLPRAGRTASGAGLSGAERRPEGGGAGRPGETGPVRSAATDSVWPGLLSCSDAARWTVARAAVGGAAWVAGARPAI